MLCLLTQVFSVVLSDDYAIMMHHLNEFGLIITEIRAIASKNFMLRMKQRRC